MLAFGLRLLSNLHSPPASEKGAQQGPALTMYQALFDMERTLCKEYPALTPFSIRRERLREVVLLVNRTNTHPKDKDGQEVDSKGRIRVHAGDKWF